MKELQNLRIVFNVHCSLKGVLLGCYCGLKAFPIETDSSAKSMIDSQSVCVYAITLYCRLQLKLKLKNRKIATTPSKQSIWSKSLDKLKWNKQIPKISLKIICIYWLSNRHSENCSIWVYDTLTWIRIKNFTGNRRQEVLSYIFSHCRWPCMNCSVQITFKHAKLAYFFYQVFEIKIV